MNSKEAATHWRGLARHYHAMGFNIVPLGNDKRPVITGVSRATGKPLRFQWEDWATTRQDDKLFDAMLGPSWWADVRGVAAISGPVSGNLVCFDFDHCPETILRSMLDALSLPGDYPWRVKTPGGGFHLWVRVQTVDGMPDKGKERRGVAGVDGGFVELRWTGHYTALPGSIHPAGGLYAWMGEQPEGEPWTL